MQKNGYNNKNKNKKNISNCYNSKSNKIPNKKLLKDKAPNQNKNPINLKENVKEEVEKTDKTMKKILLKIIILFITTINMTIKIITYFRNFKNTLEIMSFQFKYLRNIFHHQINH